MVAPLHRADPAHATMIAPAIMAAIVVMPSLAALRRGRRRRQAQGRNRDRRGRGKLQDLHSTLPYKAPLRSRNDAGRSLLRGLTE